MSRSSSPSRAGRWFLAGLGLLLALVGAVFVWLMARSFDRAREMRNWPEVPCEILVSELAERQIDPNYPSEYSQKLAYGYEWQGRAYTGDHSSLRGNAWTSIRPVAEKRVAEYPAGSTSTCRVDPENPEVSVLKPDSLAPGYSIWFPAIFLVGGLVMAYRALRPHRPSRS
ncbi:MAG: DUF3592 domain-containing protein [Luteolibacter sp.]